LVPGVPLVSAVPLVPWLPLVPRSPLKGDAQHVFEVAAGERCTHVRLRIYPDGGVARLRVHGVVVPSPALLGAETLPSAADAELAAIGVPAGVVPSVPPDPLHPRGTVDALLRLLPSAVELPGCPPPPRPDFPPRLESFLAAVAGFAAGKG
jgi:Allantoicase repeat